jgi:hypothetical protein
LWQCELVNRNDLISKLLIISHSKHSELFEKFSNV